MMEQPKPFIQSTEKGFQLNPEVVDFFSTCESPGVVVVSVAGRYREGKSFLANYLLDEQKGFALGSALESATKGLWVWCKPHPTLKDHLLVVIDTEGLEDPKKGDPTHDVHIFTLAVLICSYFILNSVGKIDHNSIQTLRLATEMVEKVRVNANEEANAEDLREHFPAFGLVLRDFFLEKKIDGSEVTPDDYLEDCLESKKGTSRTVRDYNLPREVIKEAFPSRKCWCLPRPLEDTEKLQQLDEQPFEELKPEFIQEILALKNDVLQKAKPFAQCRGQMSASQWIKICESYVSAINRGACPAIKDAFMFMVEEENRKAHREAMELYNNSMSEKLSQSPHEIEDLMEYHMQSQKKANTLFTDKAWCSQDEKYNVELLQNLQEAVDRQFKFFERQNAEYSSRFCEEVMAEVYHQIVEKIDQGAYAVSGGYQMYEKDRAKVRESYLRRALGPEKEKVFHRTFFEAKKTEVSAVLQTDKALSKKEQDSAELRLREQTDRHWREMEEATRRRTMELEEKVLQLRKETMESGKQKLHDTASHNAQTVANLCGLAGTAAAAFMVGPEMAPIGNLVGRGIGVIGSTIYSKYLESKAETTDSQ